MFLDESGIIRAGWGLQHLLAPLRTIRPALVTDDYCFTELVVPGTHHRVVHGGVSDRLV